MRWCVLLLPAAVLAAGISLQYGCAKGCTRVISLAAHEAADAYLEQSGQFWAGDRAERAAFDAAYGPSLVHLRTAWRAGGAMRWQNLSQEELTLALARLVAHERDDEEDKLLRMLAGRQPDPFIADRFGRVPFALAVRMEDRGDPMPLRLLVPLIERSRHRPADQVMCGLHDWVGSVAAAKLRAFCPCEK